ncbi:LOW QUALITY PROTEIN: hypothetical protein KUTeg_019118 [Tegillarca granosa]|uniref:VWFC domain-containing protein n=1 Tax=Tegillarca granosa TaxID=220873 RepID=A0ABQ9EBM1_TEGGR|nr:LOW QUALITY PROTEIN: hypothetical protein KUTeg_019118 [Tegillarca granosa]
MGVRYQKGQKWDDGCTYTCECIDDSSVCSYKGKLYTQDQKWVDGCDKNCVCQNAKTGYYECTDRCLKYENLNPSCVMVPDTNDPLCCLAPKCDQKNTTNPSGVVGGFTGYGLPPTLAPGLAPTPAPVRRIYISKCIATMILNTLCHTFCIRFACIEVCSITRDRNGKMAALITVNVWMQIQEDTSVLIGIYSICGIEEIYIDRFPYFYDINNSVYIMGYHLDKGRHGNLVVIRYAGVMMQYQDRCPTYPALSADCSLVTDPLDSCCQIPKCLDKNTTDPTKVVTGITGTITGSKLPENGQTWQDGCTYNCICSDSSTGTYRCTERCAHYPQLPPTCTMIADPNDACCETAYCTPKSIPTAAPHLQPTLQPGLNPNLTPLPGQTFAPQTLKPGQTLAPGLTPVPGNTLAPNPNNNTNPSGQTPVVHACIYNNQYYQQGQMWFDGCNSKCVCENGITGFYRCQERCRKYISLPSTCTLVPDPNDPSCCKVPSCSFVTPSIPPTPGFISQPTPPSGIITGYGKVPTPMPTPSPQPGVSTVAPGLQPVINVTAKTGKILYTAARCVFTHTWSTTCNQMLLQKQVRYYTLQPGCLYKGKVYNINDKWDDGCDYQCTCMNDLIGKYQCVQRCQEFPNLPNRCVLIQNPNDKCCKAPYCDFINPTPFPNGVPTPAPTLTPKPGVNPMLTPLPGYCVYKGVYYTQGQTWADGCKYNCRCEDVSRGIYACSQRCQVFNNLPSNCQLLTDQNDPCCLVPDCNVYPTPRPYKPPQPGVSTPTPGSTTHMPLILPTPITGSFSGTESSCCSTFQMLVYTRAWHMLKVVHGVMVVIINASVWMDLKDFTDVQTDMCLYTDGKQYANGTSWNDNCDRCKCEDPKNNVYKCEARNFLCLHDANHILTCYLIICVYFTNIFSIYRCKAYSNLPSICTLIPDPVDSCCEIPKCGAFNPIMGGSFNGTGTPPPGGLNEIPIGTHNIFTGSTLPGSVVTGKRDVCVYKGLVYKQGESWEDACAYVCSCDNATQGVYRCISRCPKYPVMPSYCNEVQIPGQCCPTVSCDIPGFGAYNPIPQLNPTPAPPKSIAPTKPGATPPSQQIISVGYGPNITGGSSQFPGGGFPIQPSQFSAVRTQCIYKGKVYNQGEKWDDDCDYACTCLDGRAGYYECSAKCPTYENITAYGCYLETPTQGCCKQPKCDIGNGVMVNPNLMPGSTIPVFGSYGNGFSGFRPNSNFSITTAGGIVNGGSRRGCVYKGVLYQQGQQWDDGCDYHCRCIDAFAGRYQCNNKCPTYTKLPPVCALITVPNKCCKEVRCGLPITTTTAIPTLSPPKYTATPTPFYNPDCHDKIDNCPAYGQTSCTGAYKSWAMRNCQRYCGLCRMYYGLRYISFISCFILFVVLCFVSLKCIVL